MHRIEHKTYDLKINMGRKRTQQGPDGKTTVISELESLPQTTSELIEDVLSAGQQQMGYDEMVARRRIMHVLRDARQSATIDLEDADHKLLCGLLRKHRWAFYSEQLVDFVTDVLEAPVADKPATKAGKRG